MYRNCVYSGRGRCVKLFTWDELGNRVTEEVEFSPYLYTDDPIGEFESIYGGKVSKREFETSYLRNKFVNDSGLTKSYEKLPAAQQFLLDRYWMNNTDDGFDKFPLKTMFIDIETFSKGSFPDTEDPTHVIQLITCYDNLKGKYITFGLKPYETPSDKVDTYKYIHCKSEEILLKAFIKYFQSDYPDILSGWNSSGFDVPYLVNRITVVLDEEWQKKLSPVGRIYQKFKKSGKFGQPETEYVIEGISCVDYMVLYQKFKFGKQESYSLNYISELELDAQKLEYDGQLWELSIKDWKTFVDYNILDVELIVKMDEKLQYMKILRFLANAGLTNPDKAIDTLPIMNGALSIQARKRDQVIPTFSRNQKTEKNPGAYVREPIVGFADNIVSFDANSLYPSVMISLNLSPETKIGSYETINDTVRINHRSGKTYEMTTDKFNKYVESENVAFTKAGFLFSQKKRGIVPEYLDWLYSERKKMQGMFKEAKKALEDPTLSEAERAVIVGNRDRYDAVQYAYKINLNSLYGYMGNPYAPMGDDDIASSVTLTGQAVIRKSDELFKEGILKENSDIPKSELDSSIIYGDTDSIYVTLNSLVKRGVPLFDVDGGINEEFLNASNRIENYINKGMHQWAVDDLNSNDPRFIFKRETICDTGMFLKKKYYVLHMVDDEGFRCEKYKYTGVSLVKVEIPKELKPYMKNIVETMMETKDKSTCDAIFGELYEKFSKLPLEVISSIRGINTFDKYVDGCQGFHQLAKGMQAHMKAGYFHNQLLKELDIGGLYPEVKQGDKIKVLQLQKPNRYNIDNVGYIGKYPQEFRDIFTVDTEQMFEKLVYNKMKDFYIAVNWHIRRPSENVRVELEDLFGL